MLPHCEVLLCFFLIIASAFSATINRADRELECYSQNKVYHERSDKCYKLLSKGPCNSGEWLVLERPKKDDATPLIKPICVRELCEEGQYYWPSEKACFETKDVGRLCGDSHNEELVNNVFGEGKCSCAKEPPRARLNGDKKNSCYQLYTQGPCKYGQVIVLPADETENAVCIQDPCHNESVIRKKNGSLSKDGILAPFENGTCYELGTRGPCSEYLIFKVHSITKRPTCTSLLNDILSGKKLCAVDENCDCQVVVPKKKKNYLKELQYHLKNK